ncbi:hypothetical protein [Acetobacter orleanensis]|uniref:Uncharacterized protein n=1 Tax=Acetobacter orleanensis TaxID=104099 RepID=A0A4Y3TKD2_9PROT|nr:hypothetical protein [Acetobacter orleanensis]KXV62521.1 hypothetical protein AD949_10375 [Acetobacter orleanensis]PCD80046.1 hypothetical protein CO710_04115 [Acetobacter orleanensis]GAN68367.1 hypothetical protein Abol_015_206 [Acetobacter orleanensis JCM 7639]GBR29685.1 hypothetical protein AA0473_2084 [Acetobacter orleanensis NRIC 0473]GEB82786.1 hypothetical protein AOR01nite_12630 [Acetobacter orleanensis]
MTDKLPHETSSLHALAERATKEPKLLTKAEVTELADFVLKGGEHASEQEREIAKKARHNPEGVEKADIVTLARKVLDRK